MLSHFSKIEMMYAVIYIVNSNELYETKKSPFRENITRHPDLVVACRTTYSEICDEYMWAVIPRLCLVLNWKVVPMSQKVK